MSSSQSAASCSRSPQLQPDAVTSQLASNDNMNARIQRQHNFNSLDTPSTHEHPTVASPNRSSLPIAAYSSSLSATQPVATAGSDPIHHVSTESKTTTGNDSANQPSHIPSLNASDDLSHVTSQLDHLRVDSNRRSDEFSSGRTDAFGLAHVTSQKQHQHTQTAGNTNNDNISESIAQDPVSFTHLETSIHQPPSSSSSSSGPDSTSASHSPSSSGSDSTHLTTAQELVPSFLLSCPPTIGRTQSCHTIGRSASPISGLSAMRQRCSSASSETNCEQANHAHHAARQLATEEIHSNANNSGDASAGGPSVVPGLAPIDVGSAAHSHKHFRRCHQSHHFHSVGNKPTIGTVGSSSDDSPPDAGPPAPFNSHPSHARQHQSAFQQKRAQLHSKIQALHAQSDGSRQPVTIAAALTSPTFNVKSSKDVVPVVAFNDLKREHMRLQQQHLQLLKLHHQLQLDHQKLQIVTSGIRGKNISKSDSHSSSGTSLSSNSSFSSSPSSSANNHPALHSLRLHPSPSSSPDSLAPSSATRGISSSSTPASASSSSSSSTSAPSSASSARTTTSSPPRLNHHSAQVTNHSPRTGGGEQSSTHTPTVYVSADRASYAQNQLQAKQSPLPFPLHSTVNLQHPPASNLTPSFHHRASQSSDGSITSSILSRSSTTNEHRKGGQGSTSGLRSMTSSSGAASSSAYVAGGAGSTGTGDNSRNNSDCDDSNNSSDCNSSAEPMDWRRMVSPLPDVSTDDDLANTMFVEDRMLQQKYRQQQMQQQRLERDQDHDNDGERRILPSVSPMSMTQRQ